MPFVHVCCVWSLWMANIKTHRSECDNHEWEFNTKHNVHYGAKIGSNITTLSNRACRDVRYCINVVSAQSVSVICTILCLIVCAILKV